MPRPFHSIFLFSVSSLRELGNDLSRSETAGRAGVGSAVFEQFCSQASRAVVSVCWDSRAHRDLFARCYTEAQCTSQSSQINCQEVLRSSSSSKYCSTVLWGSVFYFARGSNTQCSFANHRERSPLFLIFPPKPCLCFMWWFTANSQAHPEETI